jgi:hypothetical protein
MTMSGNDQKHLSCTELDASIEYVNIAQSYGIKTTLFLTGKSVLEEPEVARSLALNPFVELGGHTYSAFKPLFFYRLSQVLLNRRNGPYFFQNHQVKKTVQIFKEILDVSICSWRDHGYREDQNTKKILVRNKIKFISNDVDLEGLGASFVGGMVSLPVNTLPDHDYIFHGDHSNSNNRCHVACKHPESEKRMEACEWLEVVKEQVRLVTKKGGCATLLVHPACMKITDDFEMFRKLCEFLQDYNCLTVKELEHE